MLSSGVFATAVDGTPWILVVTTGLTALGVILGAAITPLGDFLTRKDQLKGYNGTFTATSLTTAIGASTEGSKVRPCVPVKRNTSPTGTAFA